MDGSEDGDGDRVPLVLIVDDSSDCQYLWKRYLSMIDCRTASAYCGADALELIRQERPAAIILDVMLPDVTGWHVLQTVKEDQAMWDIPVVMCSALDEREFGLSLGADDYLRKPVTCRMFLSALARVGIC